jgi:predicted ester cyclase
MHDRRFVPLVLISVVMLACGGEPGGANMEDNKALARQLFQDLDASGSSLDFIDRWMTPDFQTHINSPNAIDLAGYRQFMAGAVEAFPDMHHEIQYMIAEDDLVAVGITLHMVHRGEYLGVAPTGRTVSVEEIVVLRLRDGRVSEEWVLFDVAGLQQQLEAPAAAPS